MEHRIPIRDYNKVVNELSVGTSKQKEISKKMAKVVLACVESKKQHIVLDSDNEDDNKILELISGINNKPLKREKIELTKEQIGNWRKMLCMSFGAYAYLMPDKEVVAHAELTQEKLNQWGVGE